MLWGIFHTDPTQNLSTTMGSWVSICTRYFDITDFEIVTTSGQNPPIFPYNPPIFPPNPKKIVTTSLHFSK